ncbi:heat repeat protein [Apiospora aurea]|uniref:Heat repeat protein n=1 Tax=Apiospora aurea TaxID=335848 RepID=A0ABR1PW52_9PEZI
MLRNTSRMGVMGRHNPGKLGDPYWGTLPPPEGSPSKGQPAGALRRRTDSLPAELPSTDEPLAKTQRERDQRKRFGISDPATWASIHRTLAQQRRLSSIISPGQFADEVPRSPSIPSRTSSQCKALRHFTRELEKYAEAAGAAGKLPVITPTESDSKPSIHTVKPLLPYRSEFQAAGLAVTSEEQRGKLPAEVAAKFPGPNSRRDNKLRGSLPLVNELDGQNDDRCTSSIYSDDTYIRFTPEDGVSTAMLELMREKKEDTVQRRPLPWLRKKEAAGKPASPEPNSANKIKIISDGKIRTNLEETNIPEGTQSRHQNLPPTDHITQLPLIKKVPPTPPQDLRRDSTRNGSPQGPAKLDILGTLSKPVKALGKRPPGLKREDALAAIPRVGVQDGPPMERRPKFQNNQTAAKGKYSNLPFQGFIKQVARPQKHSPAPELPRTWKHTISTTSSLERALDAVSRNTEKREDENHRPESYPGQRSFAGPSTNRPRHWQGGSVLVSKRRQNIHPLPVIQDNESCRDAQAVAAQDHPPVELEGQPWPKVASPKKPNGPPPHSDQIQLHTTPEPKRSAVEEALSDLDVFFDYDDSDIKDRDVLRGLQLAVHAAADDSFDAQVRQKTGLRIRRFLADLSSVEVLDNDKITEEQPAR